MAERQSRRHFLGLLGGAIVTGVGVACGISPKEEKPLIQMVRQEAQSIRDYPPVISPEESAFRDLLSEILSYMQTSGSHVLQEAAVSIDEQNQVHSYGLKIITTPPPGLNWTDGDPQPIDLYFQPLLASDRLHVQKINTFLVISPQFIRENQLTEEEIAVILAQKLRVFNALSVTFSAIARSRIEYDIQALLSVKSKLEILEWWDMANRVILPLEKEGKLESERLRQLIPQEIYPNLKAAPKTAWENWAANLPPTIFPGLSGY